MLTTRRYWGIGWLILVLSAGCGGGLELGGDIRVPADRQRQGALDAASGDSSVRLPEDCPFNIHLNSSDQNDGISGSARGDSDASPDGSGFCEATAEKGGTANGEFQLGHRIRHTSDQAHVVSILIAFDLEQTLDAPLERAPKTDATVHLNLAVLDSSKRALAQMAVFQADSDDVVTDTSLHDERTVTVRFEPHESYDVYLYGKVHATADEDQMITTRLSVDKLSMRFDLAPTTAPAK